MIRAIVINLCATISFASAFAEADDSLSARDEFRVWAGANARRLATVESRDDQSDLAPLGKLIGPARVVAMGETIHGAHEEMALRNRFIRYLVTECHFTTVALEAGLSQSKTLYDHVLGRIEATPEEITSAFTYGFGAFEENHALVRWLREYNAGVAPERRVRLYGFDLAGSYFDNAHRSLDAVLAYLDRVASKEAPTIRADYAAIQGKVDTTAFLKLSQPEQDRVAAKLVDLSALIRRNRVGYVAASSRDDYEWALRQSVASVQDSAFQRALPRDFGLGKTKGGGFVGWDAAMNQRDATMAENVAWILDREGPKGKMFLYAHNYHVQSSQQPKSNDSGEASAAMEGGFPLGTNLRSMLGDELVVLGSQCGEYEGWPAEFRTRVAPPTRGSLKDLAGSAGIPLYLADLRQIREPGPLRNWMHGVHVEGIFANRNVVPARAYDALIFQGILTPARKRQP
ncbi:erythromycin esterase family protein [Singulisphaera sp. PoT]|uniref:erythromycin esterase family protein n=1 Tax=Singulisphaera sp. PoT TaxID=3411797 RepID=UPI003BF53BA1